MTERYERIRAALAMGPTPGPWRQGGNGQAPWGHQVIAWVDNEPYVILNCNQHIYDDAKRNAAYIAACDPDTIRALLEERDALRVENEQLREVLDELMEALQAIVDEVSDGRIPYSSDSYLPAHMVEQARAAIDAALAKVGDA